MTKRGDLARENVKDTIIEAFKKDGNYIDIQNKKIYVQARDGNGGEIIQFAITITMPKAPIVSTPNPNDWTQEEETSSESISTTLDPADQAKVEELKKILGVE